MLTVLRHHARAFLEARGYWMRHRSVLPIGIDYQHDIRRLGNLLGVSIRVFLDVGANTGQTSIAALNNFPQASIYAFEPAKAAFSALTAKIRDRRFRAYNVALSDKSGQARFFDYGPLATSNSLVERAQYAVRAGHAATMQTVDCETLDDLCAREGITNIDVLKIDTEGHDLAVLAGATRMLDQDRIRFVYVEFNSLLPKPDASGGALLPISECLEPRGFRFVATYPDYLITTGEFFVTSNALFVRAGTAQSNP